MTTPNHGTRVARSTAQGGISPGFNETSTVTNASSGKYRMLAELGSGGMARVYLAVSQGLAGFNKLVVLKILKRDFARNAELRAGFLREARLSARMNHPNVVAVNEVEERDDVPVIVMEYLQGQPFSAILRRIVGKAPLDVPLRILSDSLSGLHYAHELADFDGTPLRLVHRDFTPQNIFVTYDGSVKVLDFGVAQATRSKTQSRPSSVRGKLRYMSPEQVAGAPLDRTSDVFAAGVVLCELATGHRFWGDLTDSAVIGRIKCGDIPTPQQRVPSCPPEIERICARALAFDPCNRYQTVAEMQQDIEAFTVTHSSRIANQDMGRRLAEWFQSERREAQQLIEASLSNDTYVSWSTIAAAPLSAAGFKTPPATATQTAVNVTDDLSQSWRSIINGRPRLTKRLGQVASAILLLSAGALLLPSRAPRATATPGLPSMAASAPKRAAVRITSFPASATLFIDDVPASQNPFSREYVVDDRWHQLRVQAPGHESVEQRVQFTGDVELVISLRAEATPTPSPKAASKAGRVIRGQKPTKRARGSCSPPFTYDQRGLKHFKPECL